MKKLLFGIMILLGLGLLTKFGVVVGGGMVLVCGFVANRIFARMDYSRTIDRYKTRYEDIFVISRHPYTNEEFNLWGDEFDDLVVWADFEDVMSEVSEQEDWLREADNPFFVDDQLNQDQKIKVHAIIYQDGEFVNEKWNKEFRKRARKEIATRRAKRHAILKKADPVWYHQFSNRQRGLAWSKQKV